MSETLEHSKQAGPHATLGTLAGNWEGTAKTWFEPGDPVDSSPIHGSIRLILDGRFALHEYRSSFDGKPTEGVMLLGHDLSLVKTQSIWMDTFHNGTAMMFSEGDRGDASLNVLGGYTAVMPGGEQRWGWRTAIELAGKDELHLTAWNVTPDGAESLAVEIRYHRTAYILPG